MFQKTHTDLLSRFGLLLAAVALALTGALAAGCETTRDTVRGDSMLNDLNTNTEAYLGQRVSIRGEVDRVYSANMFTVENGGGIMDDEVLIVLPEGVTVDGGLFKGQRIEVSGDVRQFFISEIERDYDVTFTPVSYELEYDADEPVIIADTVRVAPRSL